MSLNIFELIRRFCPDGVEYKLLGDVATVVRGASPRPISKYLTTDVSGVNWIKIGDVVSGTKYITQASERITEDGAKKSRFVHKGDFVLSNSMSFGRPYIMKIDGCIHDGWLSISDFGHWFVSDFLYYLLGSSSYQRLMQKKAPFGGAVQNLNVDIVKSLSIPVPPLPVQQEIVRILDTFDTYRNDVTAGLAGELAMRRKQFQYWQEKLLTFDDSVPRKALGELGEFFGGLSGKTKADFMNGNAKFVTYKNVYENRTVSLDVVDTVCISDGEKQRSLEYGDVLFTGSSETLSECGMSSVLMDYPGEDLYLNSFCFAFRFTDLSGICPGFMKYLFRTPDLRMQISKTAAGTTRFNVSKEKMKKVKIPIPPLAVQQEIVRILDVFVELERELERELELRAKQFEYYRDHLLAFPEKKGA